MCSKRVYANGQLLGSMGQFTAKHVKAFYSRSENFYLPALDANDVIVLALRFYVPVAAIA